MRLAVIALFALAATASAEIIPQSRRITWDPGVRGGIPNRTTVYTNLPTTVTTTAFQNALNACPSNQVVQLTNGTYTITTLLVVPTGVTLRGNGISNSIIVGSGIGALYMIGFDNGFDDGWSATARSITAGNTKGSTNLTTSVAHGWTAGDIVLIDMLEQTTGDPPIEGAGSLGSCNWCGRGSSGARPIGQLVKILTTPTTTTCTIDPPLYYAYANTPQGVEMTGLTHYAGIEDLTLNAHAAGVSDIVGWFGAVNCWTKRVEQKGINRRSDWFYTALWWQKEGCWIHEGIPVGTDFTSAYRSDHAYGPFLGMCSAGLMTDNIVEKTTMGVAWEGPAAGNVVSFNYFTNIWWETINGDANDAPKRFGPLMHGPHPFMNLIEGNFTAGRVRADEYWGTSSHFTVARNRVIAVDRGVDDSQNWAVDIERRNWYWNFVGNVIGGPPGVSEVNYEYINGETRPYTTTTNTIWALGYNSLGDDNTLFDTNVLHNMIRVGNWTFRTNDGVAGSGIINYTNGVTDVSDVSVPSSYYLAAAPSFFTSGSGGTVLPWPLYQPGVAGATTNLPPAGLRYYGITNYSTTAATAPLITSSTNQIATNYVLYVYQITTDVAVDNYGATNLPNPLTVGSTSGLISNVINIANTTVTNDVGLFATNSTGSGQTNMALKIVALAAPVIDSPTTADGTNGVAFTYQITGTQYPTNFGASGLPTGLSVSLATGLISGTPSQDGTFMVTLAATNGIGSDTETLTLEIDAPAPVISVTPSSLSFTEIAETQTSDLVFAITNTGGASSTLTGNLHTASSPFSAVAPTNFSLAGGTGTNMTVRYSPVTKGTNTSTAIFESNAGNVTNAIAGVCYPLASSWVDIPMTNSLYNQPFYTHAGNYIFQTNTSSATDGGRAVYGFTVTNAGTFTFAGKTESTSLGDDSMYFQLDGDPVDPDHNWAWIGPTSFTTNKVVTWPPYPNTTAQEFTLQPGIHKFVLRGREGGAHLRSITVTQTSGGPAPGSPANIQIIGGKASGGVLLQ